MGFAAAAGTLEALYPQGTTLATHPNPCLYSSPAPRVDLTLRSRKVGPSLESLEEGQVRPSCSQYVC